MIIKRFVCVLMTLFLMLAVAACSVNSPKEVLENSGVKGVLAAHFIDVGQGDSTLLESGGEYVLIDAGDNEIGGVSVNKYLRSLGVDRIKYMIATHPHSDHIGGMRDVLNSITTENFITVETDCSTNSWQKTLKKVEELGINYIDAVTVDTYSFGGSQFTIMAPLKDYADDYNNCSLVIKATCGDSAFLIEGDAKKESEYDMLDAGEQLRADVLRCGHHGSNTSSSSRFLRAVNPSCTIISLSSNNPYGYPHKETLQRLELLGSECCRTDLLGDVKAVTDGKTITVSAGGETLYRYTAGTNDNNVETMDFVGNKNSMIFHDPICEGVGSMDPKNRIALATRQEALDNGYIPCPHCDP